MSKRNSTNLNFGKGEEHIPFYKKQEFVLYRVWYSLPAFLKGKRASFLRNKMGYEEELMLELLGIKTQKQFAEKYGLVPATLTEWNKYIDAHYDPFDEVKQWSKKLIKNVISATYNSALQRDPKANADRKLFLQLQGWVEETKQTHKVENFTDLIKGALNARRKTGDNAGVPGKDQERS